MHGSACSYELREHIVVKEGNHTHIEAGYDQENCGNEVDVFHLL